MRLKGRGVRGLNPAFGRSLPLLADQSLSFTPAERALKMVRRNSDIDSEYLKPHVSVEYININKRTRPIESIVISDYSIFIYFLALFFPSSAVVYDWKSVPTLLEKNKCFPDAAAVQPDCAVKLKIKN